MARPARLLTNRDIDNARDALARSVDCADDAGCVVGFDGFVDSIIDAVASRRAPGPDGYQRMSSLRDFAQRVDAAAGRSANIELVVKQTRVGGNGPILAGALAALGAGVHCIGALDHPVFDTLSDACDSTVSLGPPGATDALEFDDGKLMLGKAAAMDRITWSRIVEASAGLDALIARCNAARVIAPCGWTMIPAMNDIWTHLADDVLPALDRSRDRVLFVDFSDPAKRPGRDLRDAVELLRRVNERTPVTIGLNLAEALRIGALVGAPGPAGPDSVDPDSVAALAQTLRDAVGVDRIVVHHHRAAALDDQTGSFTAPTAFTPTPLTSTGAGDHCNAGLCYALAVGLGAPAALACAVATSGLFVRTGQHPTLESVIGFLDQIPLPGS